jgi:hydroxyversicolorone monooxygenase
MRPASYACQVIKKLQLQPNIRSLAPRQDITDRFAQYCQEWNKGMAWSDDCPSWYKNAKTGRVQSIWPGITPHFARVMSTPRWEDFEYTYKKNETGVEGNPLSYLGKGIVPEMLDPGVDDSPHVGVGKIDPTWTKAVEMRRR